MKNKILILTTLFTMLLFTFGVVAAIKLAKSPKELFTIGKPDTTSIISNKPVQPVESTIGASSAPSVSQMAVQAWIYPGPPACTAMNELADGRKIDVLKAEYFTLTDQGEIRLLTEVEDGCNAFSTSNIELIKSYSQYQFATVSTDHLAMRIFFGNKEKYTAGITTLVDFVKKYNIDGIEIDFEDFSAWTDQDYYNYKTFLADLTQNLHTISKYLMVDGPPLTQSMQQYYKWNYSEIAQLADYVVVMAYDYQYDEGKGTFIAPNNWVKEVYEYSSAQVQPQKLIIGIPSYGYHTDEQDRIILDTAEQSRRYAGFSSAKFSEDSFEYYWEFGSQFYTTQKKEGLAKKVEFVKTLGANSISIWHLGGNPWFN